MVRVDLDQSNIVVSVFTQHITAAIVIIGKPDGTLAADLGTFADMNGTPGHKASRHLIEREAYRRIMAGDMPGTLSEFSQHLLNWFGAMHPDASPITLGDIEEMVRETWHHRHDMVRGG